MKTLYEILEVSESASNEIIEKAYKVLAKKNHPDLQPEEQKQQAEQVMKQINEAYSVLSDELKRKQYDEKLKLERQRKEEQRIKRQYQNISSVNTRYQEQKASGNMKQEIKLEKDILKKQQKEMQAQYEQKYQEAYEDYLRRLGYKIKYKWTWKNYRNLLITIIVMIAIGIIIWYFPPTHQMLVDFYESNNVIKTIIDVVGNILVGIWNAIASIFK